MPKLWRIRAAGYHAPFRPNQDTAHPFNLAQPTNNGRIITKAPITTQVRSVSEQRCCMWSGTLGHYRVAADLDALPPASAQRKLFPQRLRAAALACAALPEKEATGVRLLLKPLNCLFKLADGPLMG